MSILQCDGVTAVQNAVLLISAAKRAQAAFWRKCMPGRSERIDFRDSIVSGKNGIQVKIPDGWRWPSRRSEDHRGEPGCSSIIANRADVQFLSYRTKYVL